MKAFILAAGESRRLRPLTDRLPKCLVPVGGTPLLSIWLQLLQQHGVTDVLINMHHAHEALRRYVEDAPGTLRITLAHEPRLLGSAGTVLHNRAFVDAESRFFIVYADVLTSVDLTRMLAFHDARRRAVTIGVAPTDRPQEKGTVVLNAEGDVLAFEEKAAHPRSNLANAGIYIASPRLFDYLPDVVPDSPLDFGHDILPRMTAELSAYTIDEFLLDIGTPEAYALAQRLWPATIHADVRPA